MTTSALLFDDFKTSYEKSAATNFTLSEYFDLCKKDPMTYALAAERMVKAIGEPRMVGQFNQLDQFAVRRDARDDLR